MAKTRARFGGPGHLWGTKPLGGYQSGQGLVDPGQVWWIWAWIGGSGIGLVDPGQVWWIWAWLGGSGQFRARFGGPGRFWVTKPPLVAGGSEPRIGPGLVVLGGAWGPNHHW